MMSVRSMLSVVMSFVVVVCIDAVKNELESSKMIECIEKTTKINLRYTGIELDDEESKILNTYCKGIDKGKIYNATLKGGKTVVLTGFGTFTVMKRKKRVGVNPATGKKMEIPAKKVPKFKPGKALKISS